MILMYLIFNSNNIRLYIEAEICTIMKKGLVKNKKFPDTL